MHTVLKTTHFLFVLANPVFLFLHILMTRVEQEMYVIRRTICAHLLLLMFYAGFEKTCLLLNYLF